MSPMLCIYTSSVGKSLQKVAYDIEAAARKLHKDLEVEVFDNPMFDIDRSESCTACIVVTAFDIAWCIPFFFTAYEHAARGHPTIVYATIEGQVQREMVRQWIIRDLKYVANSEYTREKLEEVNAKVLGVVYHGIDVDYVLSFAERGENVRREIGLNKVIVGYIAQGHERKGHREFAQVVREVESKRSDVQFVVLTDKKGKQHYEGTNAIVYDNFGRLSNDVYYSMIHAMDVYAHAALSEGFGLPVLEALAAGKLVVHPDYKPLTEITTDKTSVRVPIREILLAKIGGSGIIFELKVYSPQAFARELMGAIDMLKSNPTRAKVIRARAIKRAREFDSKVLYGKLLEYLLTPQGHM